MGNLDEELSARHLLNPLAIVSESEIRLQHLSSEARAAFALCCAQRCIDAHLKLPISERCQFTLSWVPVLALMWAALESPDYALARSSVQGYLSAFYEGPYNHDQGQDGPQDANENAAACAIYAAETFCRGDADSAKWAASRLIDAADAVLQKEHRRFQPLVEDLAYPTMQEEGGWLLKILAMLESQAWSPALIPVLRDAFFRDKI